MSEPIAIVVPSPGRTLHGRLYPADEPVCGVALLEGVGAASPAVARIYDELAAYMRAAGITVLRLESQHARHLSDQVPDILAALSALQSLDIERIVLVALAVREAAGDVDIASSVFMRMVESIAAQVRTTTSAGRSIAELTDTIARVREHLAGVVVLVPQGAGARGQRTGRAAKVALGAADSAGNNVRLGPRPHSALPQLVLPVLAADAASPAVTGVISNLYTWTTRILAVKAPAAKVAVPASAMRGHSVSEGAVVEVEAPAPGAARTRQLNERWVSLLERLEARAPERATQVRELLAGSNGHGDPSAVRSAGRAWRALDTEARVEWLRVCSEVFSRRPPPAPRRR